MFWVTKIIQLYEHDNLNTGSLHLQTPGRLFQLLTQVEKFFCLFKIAKSTWEYKKWGNLFCLIYRDINTYLPWKTQWQSMFSSLPSSVLFFHFNLQLVKEYKLLMLSAHFMPVSRCFLVSDWGHCLPKKTPLRTTKKKKIITSILISKFSMNVTKIIN